MEWKLPKKFPRRTTTIIIIVLIAPFVAVGMNRQRERKQDLMLFLKLMAGGFVFSQCQSEYLAWRNKRNMIKIMKKRG